MPNPLLELRQIEKSYAGVRALRGVSFDLQPGEVHALLGENGAGKSTLVKVITGAVEPDAGAIVLGDRAFARLTPAGALALGIACIYQQPALFPELSVAENLALRLEPASGLRRIDWKSRRATAAGLLARIGAPIPPDAAVRTLSMPEQQLVEIACALGAGARIVIMDEPTAALTQREQELLFKVIAELRADGVGIIYISHRLDEIFRLADRVTVLRDGESVGTCAAHAIDEAGLIKLMVGREVSQIYPPGPAHAGAPVLTLSGVGCTASGVRGVSLEIRAGEVLGLSGLVGAGGGFVSVPFMAWCNVPIHNAVATSAALGFPIAMANVAGYIISGIGLQNLPPYSFGYIWLPGLGVIACCSVLTAPLGARAAQTLPVKQLKRVFASVLYLLAAYMLYKGLSATS